MHWNHRIIFHPEDKHENSYFAVHECFYERRNAKIPSSWTEQPIRMLDGSLKDMGITLKRIRAAMRLPILQENKTGTRLRERPHIHPG